MKHTSFCICTVSKSRKRMDRIIKRRLNINRFNIPSTPARLSAFLGSDWGIDVWTEEVRMRNHHQAITGHLVIEKKNTGSQRQYRELWNNVLCLWCCGPRADSPLFVTRYWRDTTIAIYLQRSRLLLSGKNLIISPIPYLKVENSLQPFTAQG